jgi:glycylpeptide N-tetradecanoyltransferase
MCSFYHLPSTVIGNTEYSNLNAVYSYYNVATTMTLEELMGDCLILAKAAGADVFNCLDLMENKKFLAELKFGVGDGSLNYYLYNWQCPEMKTQDVGLVLL